MKVYSLQMTSWREKFNNFVAHPFVKDAAILQFGNFFNVGLGVLTSILTARLLQPTNYGLYVIISSFAGLVALFMNFGTDRATTTLLAEAHARRDASEIKNILTYFLKISSIIVPLIGLVVIGLAPLITQYFYQSMLIGNFSRLVILTFIISGTFFTMLSISLQVLRRMRHYILLDNLNTLFRSSLCIGFILLGWGVLGVLLGQFLAALILAAISLIAYRIFIRQDTFFPKLRELAVNFWHLSIKKYFKFGFLIAIDQNLGSLYQYLPMLFLGMFVPMEEIGYFKVALNYVSLPLILLGPISQLLSVQLPATKVFNPQSLKKGFIRVTALSLLITIGCMSLFLLLAPFLINLFFGQSYASSLKLIYYLSAFAVLQSIGVGIGAMFRTLDKVSVVIKINAAIIVLGAPLVFWLIKTYGLMGIVITAFSWPIISDLIAAVYLINFLSSKQIVNDQK